MKIGPTKYGSGGTVLFGRYRSGETAILIKNAPNAPELKATVSMVPYGAPNPGKHGVYIKNWSENEGVAEALVAAGVITLTGKTFPTGHTEALHGKLTKQAIIEMTIQEMEAEKREG